MIERRVRIYWLPEWGVWELLAARWGMPDFVTLHALDGVPPRCEVQSVFHSWERKAFGFRLLHPTFDPVPNGAIPPDFGILRYESYKVAKEGEWGLAAYDALRAENDRLRALFGDMREDSAALKAAYAQGRAEVLEEAAEAALGAMGAEGTDDPHKALEWAAQDIRALGRATP